MVDGTAVLGSDKRESETQALSSRLKLNTKDGNIDIDAIMARSVVVS